MGRRDLVVTPDGFLPRGEASCGSTRPPMAVWQGIPGERCHVHVYAPGRNRSLARWEKADGEPHPHRVAPRCQRYSACGGCPWMHLDADGQASARLALVEENYRADGLERYAPSSLVPCPDGLDGYRHQLKLLVGRSDRGRPRIGAFGRSTRNPIPIPGCPAVTPDLREAMRAVAHLVIDLDIWPYDPERRKGVLRYVLMRQSRLSGKVLVTLVSARPSPRLRDLAERLATMVGQVAGVHLHINRTDGNALFDMEEDGGVPTIRLLGDRVIQERLAGLKLQVGPGDFFQTNPSVAERILRDVEHEIPEERAVADLYCGVGGLTLVAARRAGWAVGVEVVGSAVGRARKTAARERLPAEFIAGTVASALPEIQRRLGGRRPVVIVNPARRGLEEGVIGGIRALNPERLIYVSCSSSSQSRDLRQLVDGGMEIESVRAYDMFPHTPHVELLAVLCGADIGSVPTKRPPQRRVVRAKRG